jgi:4-hydroxybenzoyl-CoA thioesterase
MTACFTADRTLRFGDCDFSGTAYYPAYLNILNGVVEEFWAHIGWPWHSTIAQEDWGTPTVHLTCDFAKPSRMGDLLTFGLTIVKVGRSSLRLHHTIHCGTELRWTAEQVLAACRISTYEPLPWPPEVRTKLETLV